MFKTLAFVVGVWGTSVFGAVGQIHGAGATFPYPLYSKWFSEFQKVDAETQINYQSIGSGGGIRQFVEKTVDFGATDAPMTDEQIQKAGAPLIHIPTVLGAVVITYNLPKVTSALKLSGETLADIYLGKISKWNDPKIVAENKGVTLPGDPILVVRRSDGSGTSFIFTEYLSSVSTEWKTKVGAATAVKWPVGLGGKGNEGVTGVVKQTPGSIGYVELLYAESNKLPYASLKNKAGEFVKPTLKAITAAADSVSKSIPEDFRVSLVNVAGKGVYPVAGFTYLLTWKTLPDATKATKWVKFLQWALKEGQSQAPALHYAPLPKALAARVQKAVETLEWQGKPGTVKN